MGYTADAVIAEARKWVGYCEKKSTGNDDQMQNKTWNAGSNNITWFWKWLIRNGVASSSLQGQAWCDAFNDFCHAMVGGITKAKTGLCGGFDYYTPSSAQKYKDKGRWTTSDPRPGDQIFFKNSQRIHHTGIVSRVTASTIYTIEGNTSSGAAVVANGGCVAEKSYVRSNTAIAGYGHPVYDAAYSSGNDGTSVSSTAYGLEVVDTEALTVRTGPGTNYSAAGSLKQGNRIAPDKKSGHWFHYQDGWVSGKYLQGWVKQSGKWWYLNQGYTWKKDACQLIDGKWYFFDASGWMVASVWKLWKGKWYYLSASGAMATYCYAKSTSKNLYYWINKDGIWEEKWNTSSPNLQKYKLVK